MSGDRCGCAGSSASHVRHEIVQSAVPASQSSGCAGVLTTLTTSPTREK
jgi:hypothetical protein